MAWPNRWSSAGGAAPGASELTVRATVDVDEPHTPELGRDCPESVSRGLAAGLIGVAKTDVQSGLIAALALPVVAVGVLYEEKG
jgi:hypothetical protein